MEDRHRRQAPFELTRGLEDTEPSFTPDGKWIVFKSYIAPSGSHVSRIAIDGGEPAPLSEKISAEPIRSPDGTLIALIYRSEPAGPNKMAIMPFAGGEPKLIRDLPAHYGRLR